MIASCVNMRPGVVQRQSNVRVTAQQRAIGISRAPVVPRPSGRRVGVLRPVCSSVAHPGEEASKGEAALGAFSPSMGVPDTTMAKGERDMGSGGSLGAVMERSKLQFVMPTPPQQAPKLDDGGSGGDNGKNLHNGGGGGGGDDDDDDDYFGEGDDGEGGDGQGGGGDGFFRTAIPELFDRVSIGAVLSEWYKTIMDLPLFIRRAVEMGLFSSAQLVRFLSMDVRPNLTRNISRTLPTSWAREFVGRLMADPAFCQKLVIEQLMAGSFSLYHEWRTRGEAFKNELDLVAINTLGMMAAVGATVWITAPSRSYGAVHKFPWQQMLAELPHCVFDASGPLRNYSKGARAAGLFATGAQLSAVGALAGAAMSAAGNAAVQARRQMTGDAEWTPSVPVPHLAHASGGLAAFFALNANLRYQLLGGMDRYLFSHTNYLWTYIGFTGAARVASNFAGELSRPAWQGLATETAYRPRVRRVRRKVKAGTKQTTAPGANAAAAAAAMAVVAEPSVSGVQPLEGATALVAGASSPEEGAAIAGTSGAVDRAHDGAVSSASTEEAAASSTSFAEAAAADAEAALLSSGGAVMGSPEELQGLAVEQQQQRQLVERSLSLSDSTAGQALREAVTEAVA